LLCNADEGLLDGTLSTGAFFILWFGLRFAAEENAIKDQSIKREMNDDDDILRRR
jgi:hypothetical protein